MVQRTSGTRTKVTSANAVTSTEKKLTDFPLLARIPVACTFYWTYAYARYKIKLIAWYTRKLLTKTPYELGEELYLKKPKKLVRTWIDKQEFFVLNWGKIPRGYVTVLLS
ncbi:hypothetical protein K474DRAFT_1656199 [Panus rudis PR-1116 ss-1]|nr:hypothetical protein K474DRAFT_1656199 [Panus rudis PR-1116 ss-1]